MADASKRAGKRTGYCLSQTQIAKHNGQHSFAACCRFQTNAQSLTSRRTDRTRSQMALLAILKAKKTLRRKSRVSTEQRSPSSSWRGALPCCYPLRLRLHLPALGSAHETNKRSGIQHRATDFIESSFCPNTHRTEDNFGFSKLPEPVRSSLSEKSLRREKTNYLKS
jgi:hypothetical protein